jgi:hypothetical protein
MQEIDVKALIRLKAVRKQLTKQQYKTLRGQIFAGDHIGAMKGLQKLQERKQNITNNGGI